MFFPVGRQTPLRLPRDTPVNPGDTDPPVYSVCGNREKSLFVAVTDSKIYVYLTHPQLLLCTYGRSREDISEKGGFRKAYWRYDSSALCILTTKNHILIYRVQILSGNCYNLTDPSNLNYQRQSQELFIKESRPHVTVSLAIVVNLAAKAICAVPLREELLVCLTNGFAHRISWTGQVDAEYSIRLSGVPFANDQLQSKPEFVPEGCFIVDVVYAPLIGGYCIVLNDGRAALLTSPDPRFHPNSLLGVWAHHLKDAVCTDVNHKYRILVFGCENGDVCSYHLDDATGALMQTFRVTLHVKDGPELLNRVGCVGRVSVFSHGSAFAVIWDRKKWKHNGSMTSSMEDETLPPTLAIFSPFGSQVWCSLESSINIPLNRTSYTGVDWGPEGLQLWLSMNNGLAVLPLARSASINNAVMEHSDRLVLISESRIMVSPRREREGSASAPHSVWTTLTPNNDYMASNWPIRYASLERCEARTLVVAGARGFSHCNLSTGRWKIFGNESQERDMMVTGGIFVWRGTAAAACCDSESGKEFLRFYPLNTKLDNKFCSQYETESRVLALNIRDDSMVTFDVDARILLYRLTTSQSSSERDAYPRVTVDRAAEIRVGDLITHPACLASIHITQLSQEIKTVPEAACFIKGVDTVLVNVSGRLITLNPKCAEKDDDDETRFQLNQPIMVASFVEQIWLDNFFTEERRKREKKADDPPHLTNALWISCGARGMRVWLPLLPGRRGAVTQDNFISKRIMLPFELDIRPLAICSGDCLALGIESTPSIFGNAVENPLVIYSVQRNSEVFVHHLLKQLLKRNLGVFALEIAGTCRHLPYFSHALELLLHNVLEEEATSSEPIPDPLLPRIVAFVQEFPEFLKTVAHCARKTELALWRSLFAVTSSPNDLFEVCIRDGQLQTAASFLIVLQNIENSQTSQEQAARLLREALSAGEWAIARDMVRFAGAIDAEDMDSQPRTPPPQPVRSSSRRLTKGATDADDELVVARFQAVGKSGSRIRHSENTQNASRKDSGGSGRRLSKAQSSELGPPSPPTTSNPMLEKMNGILQEHALRLLDDYCIRDLGAFWAHLDLDLVTLISQRGHISLRIQDWVIGLTRLHSQFRWPYPVASRNFVDHLTRKFGSMRSSRSTASISNLSVSAINGTTPSFTCSETVVCTESIASDDTLTVVQEARLVPKEHEQQVFNVSNGDSSSEKRRPSSPSGSVLSVQSPGTPAGEKTLDWQGVDVLCGESAARGSCTSDAQLTYMLEMFKQCAAIEWVFLLCVLRRDAATLRSEICASTVKFLPSDTLSSLKKGCQQLIIWAQQNCIGYLSVLQVFDTHLQLTADAAGVKIEIGEAVKEMKKENGSNPKISEVRRLDPVPRKGALRDSFGLSRRRERSRSVDRSVDVTVSHLSPEESDCAIM